MSPRTLKIALAASVALNLFAVTAVTTAMVTRAQVERRIDDDRRAPRENSAFAIVRQMDPQVRERVRESLRASALAARPDFEEAKARRREAVQIAASPTYDAARVSALLEQSRTAELRGRARLEADAATLLGTLEPADRTALSQILTRRGRGAARGDGDQAGKRPDRT